MLFDLVVYVVFALIIFAYNFHMAQKSKVVKIATPYKKRASTKWGWYDHVELIFWSVPSVKLAISISNNLSGFKFIYITSFAIILMALPKLVAFAFLKIRYYKNAVMLRW